MARIFLSSSFRDLRPERAAAAMALRGSGHSVVAMEDYPASAECPTDRCCADVEGSDLYVGLFARRYGFVPWEEPISITEIEYRSAIAADRQVAIFLLADEVDWRPEWTDRETGEGSAGRRIDDLRRELGSRHEVAFFRTPSELAHLVVAHADRVRR
jgi:Domain of unknown function (DUF4062)